MVATLSEEVINTSVYRPEDFMARPRTEYLQSGMKREHINRRTDNFAEEENVATAFEEGDLILVAHETAAPSDSSILNLSEILSEALKSYCQIYDCPFHEIADTLETDEVF